MGGLMPLHTHGVNQWAMTTKMNMIINELRVEQVTTYLSC